MEEPQSPQLIIAVDDEPNILMALRRTLRPTQAEFIGFTTPREALEALGAREPDLIISDMRMPDMDGAQFLERAKALRPDALRILLTGYSDYDKAKSAINEGGIWRHLSKPWKDAELIACVSDALAMRRLAREKAGMERMIHRQRDELAVLSKSLAARVKERTAKLDANFATLVKVLSGIVDARFGELRARRVAEIARGAAAQLNLPKEECERIHRAALLHLIGKISLPDELLAMPLEEMSVQQGHAFRSYPLNGEEMLMAIEDLRPEAAIIRSHRERMDGKGFPDRLLGDGIPQGAKVLGAAVAFDAFLGAGALTDPAAVARAARELMGVSGAQLCPKCADAILAAFCIQAPVGGAPAKLASRLLDWADLRPGMTLTRDAQAPSGALLLAAGQTLTPALLSQLQRFEERHGARLRYHISVAQDA